ncbi:MAG TPA: methionine biosynthesis protein MetW [Propionibacteriaceae bacterium]|nr:methionine biosynthesis protein MetW [Propionibacteriaceae bacterium]
MTALRPDLALVADLIPEGSRVLDLGCGSGDLLANLISTKHCRGTGVEIDPAGVLAAIRQGVPTIELNLDTQLSEFRDSSYDVVVLSRTLQAVHRPGVVLNEMTRIAPRLVVSMPNFGLWRHRMRLVGGHMPRSKDLPFDWHDTPNLHHATLIDLEAFFDGQGLEIERRIVLDEEGRPRAGRGANLLGSSAIYVLGRV